MLISIFSFFIINQLSTSLYAGITNQNGEFQVSNQSIDADTIFVATHNNVSSSILVESCIFCDYLTNSNHKNNITSTTGNYTYDDDGAIFDASTFSSDNYQFNVRPYWELIPVPYVVEFDMISSTNNQARLYFHNSLSGSAIASGTVYSKNNAPTHIKFLVQSNGITRYIGDEPTSLSVTGSIGNSVACRFGYWQTTQAQIKVRNYRVKHL